MFLQKFFCLLRKNHLEIFDTAEEKQNKLKKKESFHVFLEI